MAFRFRLSRVLEWYNHQYQIEAGHLRQSAERSASAHKELARHRQSRLANETQLLRLESLDGNDLRARELYHKQSMEKESQLTRICHDADRDMATQRMATLSAQRKVRLVEKLRDRKRDEFNYVAGRELEQVAAESWLAGFARNLTMDENT
jgi:DNA polymerase III gamma/tau subunit